MASPQAAQSKWVQREIGWWIANRSAERLLILLTEGTFAWSDVLGDVDWRNTDAIPRCLAGIFHDEPLFVDLRWAKEESNLTLNHVKFRSAVLDIAAPLRDLPKDEMDGEAVRALRRNRRWAWGAASALAMATLAAEYQREKAVDERDVAISRQLAAQANEFTTRGTARLALLLAVQAWKQQSGVDSETALLRALQRLPVQRMLFHEGLSTFAVSPDASRLVTATSEGSLRLWDSSSGELLATATDAHKNAIFALAFSPDAKRIASGGTDGAIRLWSAATLGTEGIPLSANDGTVRHVAFSPDGKHLVSGSSGGQVRRWDISKSPIESTVLYQSKRPVGGLAYSVDGRTLAAGFTDPTIVLWETSTWRSREPLTAGIPSGWTSIALSPDGLRLASGSLDGRIVIWDVATGGPVRLFESQQHTILSLAYSADGTELVSGGFDGTVETWNLQTGQASSTRVHRHADGVLKVAASADGQWIASGSQDGDVILAANGSASSVMRKLKLPAMQQGDGQGVVMAFHPDGKRIALSSRLKKLVSIIEAPSGRLLADLEGPVAARSLAFSPDGAMLATGGRDGWITLWDMRQSPPQATVLEARSPRQTAIDALAFSPNGQLLAGGDNDGSIYIIDSRTGQTTRGPLKNSGEAVFGLAFSPDGKWLVSAEAPNPEANRVPAVAMWDVASGELRKKAAQAVGITASSVAFQPNGATLAVGTFNGIIGMFHPRSLQLIGEWKAHSDNVLSIAYRPDGERLASGGEDGAVFLWHTDKARALGEPLLGPEKRVLGLAFSPDGHQLIGSGQSEYVFLWNVDETAWAREACRVAASGLSRYEWRQYVGREIRYTPACIDGRLVE
jgi:WD40 repeat protein